MGIFGRRRVDDVPGGSRELAHVRGIKILASTEDSPERHRLRLEIEGPSPVVAGVELTGAPRWLRYGQQLPVARHRRGLRVDWDTAAPDDEHPTSEGQVKAPDVGIDDRTSKAKRASRKGEACTVEIQGAAPATFLGLGTGSLDLETVVRPTAGESYALELSRQNVPFYAAHLIRPGTQVPGWIKPGRPDKVTIDWPQAAIATPGVGVGEFDPVGDGSVGGGNALVSAATSLASRLTGGVVPAAPSGDGDGADVERAVEGVGFDAWVAIEAGLVRDRVRPADHDSYAAQRGAPPGKWATVSSTWHARVRADWRLGTEFGAAYQEALRNGS